jgi:hypothetical protein
MVGKITDNFNWYECYNSNANGYKYFDLQFYDNVLQLSKMLEELREYTGEPINVHSWYRPVYYNDVVMPRKGYHTSTRSDHKLASAIDTSINPTVGVINKWKSICNRYEVSYSIGVYDWGMHLGFRNDLGNRQWTQDWYK